MEPVCAQADRGRVSARRGVFANAPRLYRWKSSLVMKGEVVPHKLDCAVAGSAKQSLGELRVDICGRRNGRFFSPPHDSPKSQETAERKRLPESS